MSIQALNWAFSTFIENPGAKLTLIALANFASHPRGCPDDSQECWPAQSRLAEITSLDPRSIRRNLKLLVDAGIISVRHQIGKGGRFEQNIYVLNMTSPAAKMSDGPAAKMSDGPAVKMSDGTVGQKRHPPEDKYAFSTGQNVRRTINPLEPLRDNRPPTLESGVISFPSNGTGEGNGDRERERVEAGITLRPNGDGNCQWTDRPSLTPVLEKQNQQILRILGELMNVHTFQTFTPPIRLVSTSPWRFWVPNEHFVAWWSQPSSLKIMRKAIDAAAGESIEFGPFEIPVVSLEVSS